MYIAIISRSLDVRKVIAVDQLMFAQLYYHGTHLVLEIAFVCDAGMHICVSVPTQNEAVITNLSTSTTFLLLYMTLAI